MVGVTGFEPAASTSQRKRQQSFASFWVLFGAFLSEIRAFSCRKVHNSHVVQTCKWSKLWSDLQSHIILPASTEPQAPCEVDFYCHHYSIKTRIFQVPSRLKICDAVIKDNRSREVINPMSIYIACFNGYEWDNLQLEKTQFKFRRK